MKTHLFGFRNVLVAICCVAAMSFGGCKKDSPEGSRKVGMLTLLIPGNLHWIAGTDDLAKLEAAISSSPRFQSLFETVMFNDIAMLPTFTSIRQAIYGVAKVSDAPVGAVFVDDMMVGPGVMAVQEPDGPNHSRKYLLLKHLDMSQQTVATAAGMWLRASEEVAVTELKGVKLHTLTQGSRKVHYYIHQGVLGLSNDQELLSSSAKLLLEIDPREKSVGGLSWMPRLEGPFTLLANLEAYRTKMSGLGTIFGMTGMRAVSFKVPLDGKSVELTWAPDPEWGGLEARTLANDRYVPRDAPFYLSIANVHLEKVLDTLRGELSKDTRERLDFDLIEQLVPKLDGEAFYAFLGTGEGRDQSGLEQVIGFKLKDSSEAGKLLTGIWESLFSDTPRVSVLEPLDQARLVCAESQVRPLCYGLHGDYVLLGTEPAVRRALAVGAGKAPALRDRPQIAQAQPKGAPHAAACTIDLRALTQAMMAHLLTLSDDKLNEASINEVLKPFLEEVAAFRGWSGALDVNKRGDAVGALKTL